MYQQLGTGAVGGGGAEWLSRLGATQCMKPWPAAAPHQPLKSRLRQTLSFTAAFGLRLVEFSPQVSRFHWLSVT